MRSLFVPALLLGLCVTASKAAGAQSNCGYFQPCSGSTHWIQTNFNDQSKNVHFDCLFCVQEDTYPVCHPVCQISLLDPKLKSWYEALVAAAERSDANGVLRMAPSVPGYVMWNADRRAVQIKSCTQTSLIASLSVRDPVLIAIAARLPLSELALSDVSIPFLAGR